jgi:transglutaminase-like putative cysteine protease
MFDREILLQSLKSECLSEVGSSAVVIGGHKLGKSYLLEHISSNALDHPGTLFCRLDVDGVKAASPSGRLTDHAFLREFLRQLLQHIDDTLREQGLDKEQWVRDLPVALSKATTLEGLLPDSAISVLHKRQLELIAGLRQNIAEYETLSAAADSIHKLFAPGHTIQVDELADLLPKLRGWRKRLVLLIDDYDRMVVEDGLSDNLFHLLRSDNFRRRFIALASASARLMDVVPETSVGDRKSLFNHFNTQRLIPFKDTEPGRFLEWLDQQDARDGNALNDEEKRYLVSVGGGSPHLLRQARQRFMRHKRPAETGRRQFEKESGLVDDFHMFFQRIWSWANAEEQALLKAAADGTAVPVGSSDRLESEGYLVPDGEHLRPFSSLFVDFIRKQKGKPSESVLRALAPPVAAASQDAPIACSVRVAYEVFPSALLYATRDSADVAVFTIDNRTTTRQRLQLSCEFSPHSVSNKPFVDEFEPGTRTVTLGVDLKEEFGKLKNPVWTSVRYSVTLNPGAREETLLAPHPTKVRLLPRDHFLFARYDPQQDVLKDFSWLIAAWINGREPALEKVTEAASVIHPGLGRVLERGHDARKFAEDKATALFTALKTAPAVHYFDNAVVFHSNDDDYMQRVKTPAETLRTKNGNCLDGAVLFASLLEACGLDPCIVLIPAHALVGWKVPKSDPAVWEYLDTTMLADHDFREATAEARRRLADAGPTQAPGEVIDDPKAFAILVDIHHTVRHRQIVPI